MAGSGTLLPEKSLIKGAQYLTVCANQNNGRPVGILRDAYGLKAYELTKEPPLIFWATGDSQNPYKEGLNVTPEEFAKRLKELLKALKKEKELQKSTTTQNGN